MKSNESEGQVQHKLNIIVGRTDTIVGLCVRQVFGGKYNHCAIFLDDDTDNVLSFTRRWKPFWFTGCYCHDSLSNFTEYEIFTINMKEEDYQQLYAFLSKLSSNFRIYHYVNAALLPFHKGFDSKYNYLCSTFAAKTMSYVITLDKEYYLYTPMDVYYLLSA